MSDVYLILEADGTVTGATGSAPVAGALLPGQTVRLRQGDEWIGWQRVAGVFRPPGYVDAPAVAVTVVAKVDLFRRATEDEADQISAALDGQSSRLRSIFQAAQTFRSDAEEWPTLVAAAVGMFGQARADQLLAPSAV